MLGRYGVIYTMPDKESASVAYSDIKDTSFLKRKWRFDEEYNGMAAPLEDDSITKSLGIWTYSKTILPEEQAIAVIHSACRNMFGHGREAHEKFRARMLELIKTPFEYEGIEYDLTQIPNHSKIPSFDELLEGYHRSVAPDREHYH